MSVYFNGREVAQLVLNGHVYDALVDGRWVWPDSTDAVAGVEGVGGDDGASPGTTVATVTGNTVSR